MQTVHAGRGQPVAHSLVGLSRGRHERLMRPHGDDWLWSECPVRLRVPNLGPQPLHDDRPLENERSDRRKKRYDSYKVLYLAVHGHAESVYLGRDSVSLDELQELPRGAC